MGYSYLSIKLPTVSTPKFTNYVAINVQHVPQCWHIKASKSNDSEYLNSKPTKKKREIQPVMCLYWVSFLNISCLVLFLEESFAPEIPGTLQLHQEQAKWFDSAEEENYAIV